MKKLEELGINRTPWKADGNNVSCKEWDSSHGVSFDHTVADCYRHANARLIAAAPELYDCLREAVVESCVAYCGENPIVCKKKDGECFVKKWRAALAKAAGEEVSK